MHLKGKLRTSLNSPPFETSPPIFSDFLNFPGIHKRPFTYGNHHTGNCIFSGNWKCHEPLRLLRHLPWYFQIFWTYQTPPTAIWKSIFWTYPKPPAAVSNQGKRPSAISSRHFEATRTNTPPDDLETTRQLHKERHTLLDATAAHLGYKKEHFIIQNQSTTRGQRQPVAQSFEM